MVAECGAKKGKTLGLSKTSFELTWDRTMARAKVIKTDKGQLSPFQAVPLLFNQIFFFSA